MTVSIPVWVMLAFKPMSSAQTVIYVLREQTNLLAYLRFGFFFVQLICMFWMTALVVQHAI